MVDHEGDLRVCWKEELVRDTGLVYACIKAVRCLVSTSNLKLLSICAMFYCNIGCRLR